MLKHLLKPIKTPIKIALENTKIYPAALTPLNGAAENSVFLSVYNHNNININNINIYKLTLELLFLYVKK